MLLWKKQSNRPNALFVDILDPKTHNDLETRRALKIQGSSHKAENQFCTSHQQHKSNNHAVKERNAGNMLFARKQYRQAMELYNKSLSLSEIGSENTSLAYANRSSCFFHMKFFDKCMIDIELAIKAGYPKNKMEKLEKRRIDAEKAIKDGLLVQKQTPKLSFPSNEEVPVLANAIRIENDPQQGHRFVALQDLSVGQTIYSEPCFVGLTFSGKYRKCNICLKSNKNLIPCNRCTLLMCLRCDKTKFHRLECGIEDDVFFKDRTEKSQYQFPLIRSVLLAIDAFTNSCELMDFVEKTVTTETAYEIPTSDSFESKYKAFLKFKTAKPSLVQVTSACAYYETMIKNPQIAAFFNTKKSQRFLMHLILQHFLIFQKNATLYHAESEDSAEVFEIQMKLLPFFSHSCAPNIITAHIDGSNVGIVIRPIREGERLYDSRWKILMESYTERRNFLKDYFGKNFECDCERCKGRHESIPENDAFSHVQDFLLICAYYTRDREPNEREDEHIMFEIIKSKCESFLERFGRLEWSMEIEIAIRAYTRMISDC